jgi:hypothetical protein
MARVARIRVAANDMMVVVTTQERRRNVERGGNGQTIDRIVPFYPDKDFFQAEGFVLKSRRTYTRIGNK